LCETALAGIITTTNAAGANSSTTLDFFRPQPAASNVSAVKNAPAA
jgi:hypothetical protein